MERDDAAERVERIIESLQDRSGLGDQWDLMDPETQEEIIECWTQIVMGD